MLDAMDHRRPGRGRCPFDDADGAVVNAVATQNKITQS